MVNDKVLENRLRRLARRNGYRLEKSRSRDPQAVSSGGYQLLHAGINGIVLGGSQGAYPYSASLDDVEAFLQ